MHAREMGVSMHFGWKPVWYMFRMFFSVLAVIFRCKVLKIDEGAGLKGDLKEEQEKKISKKQTV